MLEVITWTTEHFQKKGMDNPRLEAEVLLAHLMGIDRMGLYLNYATPLTEGERAAYREMIQRRTAGEPSAYIMGYKEFWSLQFHVSPESLIPCASAFSWARERAPGEMSVATIWASASSVARAMATAPQPCPISSTRRGGRSSLPIRTASSTRCSVSGRGMRLSGFT